MKISNTINKGIEKLSKEANKLVEIAVERGIVVVRNHILKNNNTPIVSGRLAGSIQGFAITNAFRQSDVVYDLKSKGYKTSGIIGTAVEYAEKVEFYSKKNKGFFQRGLNNSKSDVQNTMFNTLKGLTK